jgi:integral membrane sensor domain MASE1
MSKVKIRPLFLPSYDKMRQPYLFMRETGKIERALGAVVGAVLGAMAGATPMLWSETVSPGSTQWYHWVVTMLPGAIIGSVSGFVSGLRSIFDWR